MGPIERRLRRALNPWSTAVTLRWHGGWRRPGSRRLEFGPPFRVDSPGLHFVALEKSPGSWGVPPGERPGWSWVPPQGAMINPRWVPRWVRVWYMIPFVDRFAYEWIWWHGGFGVPTGQAGAGPDTGVREPRRPEPPRPWAPIER